MIYARLGGTGTGSRAPSGKSNRGPAGALVSHRTANKHLDQVYYPKLGLESPTAAAAVIARTLDGR